MRNMKKYLILAAATIMMTACSNDEWSEQTVGQRGTPISLCYQTLQAVDTRAAASQTLNDGVMETGKQVMVRISEHGADSYTNHIYTSAAAGVLQLPAENAPCYPLNGNNIDIKAFCPAAASSGTHTVAADQSSADGYTASDLMVAADVTDQSKTAASVPLTFTHLMAKLNVNVTPGSSVKRIKTATVKDVKPTISFSLDDLTPTAGGSATDITVVKTVGGDIADGEVVHGTALIPPQTLDGALLEIEVVLNNDTEGTATYALAAEKAFAANNIYTQNITVNGPEVGATTTIQSWNAADILSNTSELVFRVGDTNFHMVYVEGGDYVQHWTRYNEYDVTVSGTLTSFYMGETEVTRALWRAVMGGDKHQDGTSIGTQNPSVTSDDGQYPQAMVSHIDIMGSDGAGTSASCFIKKLNDALASQLEAYGLSGRKFTLPSEAQWQWAAMGGVYSHSYTYAGGNDLNAVAWNSGNSSNQTHPVACKLANELGLYDMTGNVWEWCRDWYSSPSSIVTSQGTDYCRTTQGDSSYRVLRGGSWYYGSDGCPVSRRIGDTPSSTYADQGLRLALQ